MKPFLCQQQTGLPASRSHAKCRRKLGESLANTGVGSNRQPGRTPHLNWGPDGQLFIVELALLGANLY